MPRKRRPSSSAIDMGTPEMARRFTIVPKLSDPTTLTGKVLDGSEVDRLLLVDAIDPAQHATLNMLAKRLHGYGFSGMKSPDYSSRVHADATLVADKKAESLRGAVHLIDKMDKHPHIGAFRRKKLVNLVLQEAPWGSLRHQIEELQYCVRALDDIFVGRR